MQSLESGIQGIEINANSEEQKKTAEQKKDKPEQDVSKNEEDIIDQSTKSQYLSMVNKLKANSKLMIDRAGENVVKKPPPNQRCPCGSHKVYKRCTCIGKDKRRTEQFIEGKSKEI